MSLTNALFATAIRPATLASRRSFSAIIDRFERVTTTDEHVAALLDQGADTVSQPWRAFGWTGCWRLLRNLPASADDVFLDLGCGAGRIMAAAARRPYKRVIGIEIAPEFVALARANAASLRPPHAPIEIVQTDAASYVVPDDVTVAFLYNSFEGDVLDAALAQLFASYDRRPRRILLAYGNPLEHERISASTRLLPLSRLNLSWRPGAAWQRTQAIQFYRIIAAEIDAP